MKNLELQKSTKQRAKSQVTLPAEATVIDLLFSFVTDKHTFMLMHN